MPRRRQAFDLLLVSALGLFVELTFIRWVASEIRIVAFYKNFALIAAYLGLGLGFAALRRETVQRWFERRYLPILVVCVIAVMALGRTRLSEAVLLNPANTQEFVWAGAVAIQDRLVAIGLSVAFYAVLLTLFILITVLFIPLGQLTASKFIPFAPLPGYTLNVLGSLAGTGLYVLVSFLGWPPMAWFLISGVAALYFLPFSRWPNLAVNSALALLPVALTLFWPTGAERTLWSPYYRIDLKTLRAEHDPALVLGYELSVNQAWHQRLWDLAPSFVMANYGRAPEHFDAALAEYDAPYSVAPSLDRVLIVGAGTGNDAAGALRAGARHVTAVEIDPVILKIGEELHPEQPYADPRRVTLVNQDARSFFSRDQGQYDLIVFGLLDSHTLFGTASSIRLDNFVYTEQSLAEARNLLRDGGLLALSFGVPPKNEWVGWRLYRTLTDVFGHAPQVYQYPSEDIVFFIARQPLPGPILNDPRVIARADYATAPSISPATDDWPYLYLREHTIPLTYLIMLLGIIGLSFVLVRRTLPDFRGFNLHFFFMGAAFFLLETKSVTEMALLLGSTWVVNASVIAAILIMIVLANLLAGRLKLKDPRPIYGLLAAALLFNFLFSVNNLLGLPLVGRVVLASFLQALPLFFAGLIFAVTFSQARAVETALGSNLIGAVLGGIFEYTSLAFGIRSLYVFALAFYALSAIAYLRPRAASRPAALAGN